MPNGDGTENSEEITEGTTPTRGFDREAYSRPEWAGHLAKQASKKAIQAVKSVAKKWIASAVVSVGWPILIIGAILIILIIVGGFFLLGLSSGNDPRQGTTQTQEATDTDIIREVLAKAGNTDAFRLAIISKSPALVSRLDEITSQINKLPDDKKNSSEYQALIKQINELKSQILGFTSNMTAEETQKIIHGLTIVSQQSANLLAPAGADFVHLRDAPITKILVVKSRGDKNKRKIYFQDKDGKTLGSAPVDIGFNLKKTADFKQNDNATPTGNFLVGPKVYTGKMLYSSIFHTQHGYYKIRITGGPQYPTANGKGTISILNRGIIIHGSAENKQDRLFSTAGCIRMYNNHLAYIFPLIKEGIALEIAE